MADERTIHWTGASGQKYKHRIYPLGTTFKDEPGNYIYAKESSPGRWTPVYIGETESLRHRLPNHEKIPLAKRNGGTHVHTHITSGGQQVRRAEELDLVQKWDPPCND